MCIGTRRIFMKNTKRAAILACILAVVLCFSASGCFNKKTSDSVDTSGDYTKLTGEVKFFLPGSTPGNMDEITQLVNSALKADGRNYTVKFMFESWGTYWSKVPLKVNEGIDACWMHSSYISSYYGQKILMNIEDLISAYGSKISEATSDIYWNTVKIADGVYAIPRVEPLCEGDSPLMLRGDWMDEFEMSSVGTLSELESYLGKAAEKLESVDGAYVMDKDHSNYLRREYAKNYYFPLGSFSKYPVYIDISQKEGGKYVVKNFYTSEAFKSMANKAREYYLLGYRNANRESLASDSVDNAFNNGLLGAIWSTATKTNERINAFKTLNPDGKLYTAILNPTETKWITSGGNMISVYSKSTKGAHVIDFYNWLLSDSDHSDLLCYGVLNKNYKLTADGKLDFTGIASADNYSEKFPSFVFSSLKNFRYSKEMSNAEIEQMNNWDSGENVKVSPLIGFIPEIKGAVNTAYSLINAAEKSYCEDFMYGSKGLDEVSGGKTYYEAFLNQLNQTLTYQGAKTPIMDILIAELQSQVDAYVAANNL